MSRIITTDNGQQYQTASGWKTVGAMAAGSAASSVTALGSLAVTFPCMNKMQKLSQNCDTVQIRSAIKDTFGGGGTSR